MRILWTTPAAEAFRRLPASAKDEVLYRMALIAEFPEMYPVRTHQPYAGFRYFFTRDWCVSYTLAGDAIVILAVFPVRRG